MKPESFKQLYSVILLLFTMLWSAGVVYITYLMTKNPTPVDVVAAAGAGGLSGALLIWTGSSVTYYFRKKSPSLRSDEGPSDNNTNSSTSNPSPPPTP